MSAFDPIPRSAYAERRSRLAAGLGRGVLILPAARQRYASRDTEYPYRPDADLAWATGLIEPDSVAVLVGEGEGGFRMEIFMRPRDPVAEQWAGPRMGPDAAKEWVGADSAHAIDALGEVLPGLLRGADRVFYALGSGSETLEALVRDSLAWRRGRGSRDGRGPEGLFNPGLLLDPLRLRKDSFEIERMRHAGRITMAAFRDMLAEARPGIGEWELEAILEAGFRRGGSTGPAYESIVGAGANGCVLHYVRNGDVIQDGQLVLVDAGASWDLYASDITRTFPISGRFSTEQLELYQIVEAARAAGIAAAAPGERIQTVHEAATLVLVDGLVQLGVLEGDPGELIASEAHKPFYPHQTSHWLGLDVHDVGDYAAHGRHAVLEPGMVFTVEPGLYFPLELDGTASRFAGLGIRIEDDILVTEAGVENLTEDLPTSPEELVELVGSAIR